MEWSTIHVEGRESLAERWRRLGTSEGNAWWRDSRFDPNPRDPALAKSAKFLRAQYLRMLEGMQPNMMLTFNFGYKVGAITAQGMLDKFFNMAQRRALGRSWYCLSAELRPRAIGFFEHPDTNPHFHVLVAAPDRVAMTIWTSGRQLWAKLATRGQLDVEFLHSQRRGMSYCTKSLDWGNNAENVYFYAPKQRSVQNR